MRRNLYYSILCALLLTTVLAGCCGGKSKETTVVTQPASTSTMGQELQDLKSAQEKGAITDKEFEAAKEKILKGK